MADGSLSLSDLQSSDLDLGRVRLVTLSACESGVQRVLRRVTENIFTIGGEEYVGLPAVFLERGAAAVVSSLWSVSDFSTTLLMTDFYRRYRRGGQPVARALRDAQRWLRSLRCEEVQELLLKEGEGVAATAKGEPNQAEQALLDALREAFSALAEFPRDAKPFDRLQHWAAFIATGAA
jgi:CHAT domain-containing protein